MTTLSYLEAKEAAWAGRSAVKDAADAKRAAKAVEATINPTQGVEIAKLKAEQEAIPVGTLVWARWPDVKRLALYAGDILVRYQPDGPTWKCDRVERVDLKSLGISQTSNKAELTAAYNAGFSDATYRAESFIEETFPEAT